MSSVPDSPPLSGSLVLGNRTLVYAVGSDPGRVRDGNEDSARVVSLPGGSALLAVLADGMGGHSGGRIAAELLIETVTRIAAEAPWPAPRRERYDRLLEAMARAGEAIYERAIMEPALLTMGSTGVAAVITADTCQLLYAGDSRLYHFRQEQGGKEIYRTRDQSVVQALLDIEEITPEQVANHPMRSTLTSCFGGGPRARLTLVPHWRADLADHEQRAFRPLEPGDVILLCSDGLWAELAPGPLAALVAAHGRDPGALVNAAIAAANDAGGSDNITVVAIAVAATPSSGSPEQEKALTGE